MFGSLIVLSVPSIKLIKIKIVSLSLVVFFSSILLIGSTVYAQQQEQQQSNQFPQTIIAASSTDTTPHALKLKATQQGEGENAQPKKVSGFKIDLTNVVTAQANSSVFIFVTDNSLEVIEAKVRTVSDQFIDLVPSTTTQGNAFSLANLPVGVYTLDVITQKGNIKAAYEGILVISQQPTTIINETIKQVINQEINQNTRVDTDVKVVFKKKSDKERICLFTPSHPDCKPKNGKCPPRWGMNEDGNCFPAYKKCPKGYWRADDDETGACVKKPPVKCEQDTGLLLLPQCQPDPCAENPNLPECQDPCAENPNLPECQQTCPDGTTGTPPGCERIAPPSPPPPPPPCEGENCPCPEGEDCPTPPGPPPPPGCPEGEDCPTPPGPGPPGPGLLPGPGPEPEPIEEEEEEEESEIPGDNGESDGSSSGGSEEDGGDNGDNEDGGDGGGSGASETE